MGVYYDIYAEVKTKDKWISLSPLVMTSKGELKTMAALSGQSWLSDLVNELECDYRVSDGLPADLSPELKRVFHDPEEKMEGWFGTETTWGKYYSGCVFIADYSRAIQGKVRRQQPYKYAGYVNKRSIAAFEVGEIESLMWLTKGEYNKLPKEEKIEYAYYEWNEFGEEYGSRYELYKRIEALLDWSGDAALYYSDKDYESRDFNGKNVRLIVYRS